MDIQTALQLIAEKQKPQIVQKLGSAFGHKNLQPIDPPPGYSCAWVCQECKLQFSVYAMMTHQQIEVNCYLMYNNGSMNVRILHGPGAKEILQERNSDAYCSKFQCLT